MAKRSRKTKSVSKPASSKPVSSKPAKSAAKSAAGATRRTPKRGPKRSPGRGVSLADLPTAALAAELKRRQSEIPRLEKRATALRTELAQVESRIAALRGHLAPIGGEGSAPAVAAPSRSSTRNASQPRAHAMRKGQPTIGERLVEILGSAGAIMSPRDLAGVLAPKLGREVNQNFLVQISLTLARLVKQGRIEKVGRGQYRVKGASGAAQE